MERVLVTGGAGFIGSHAAAYYDDNGVDVTVVDNLSRVETLTHADETLDTARHNWAYLADHHPDVERVQADIRNRERITELVATHDGVVHTAGQVAVTSSIEDPRTDFEVNAEGTFNVLEAARLADRNPPVVVASTNKVYGNNINDIAVAEEETRYRYDDPAYTEGIPEAVSIDDCEHTPYGVSKLAADLYVQDYAYRDEVEAAAFRMSCIYGTRQFGNEDQGWVAHFALSALRDEPLTIYGNGKQVRDVLFVDDLIRAYDAFLSNPTGKSPVYNIGGGPSNTTSLLEFVDMLEAKTGTRPDVSFDDWREGDQRIYVSDIARARAELDWEPLVAFEDGIDRFIDWYRSTE